MLAGMGLSQVGYSQIHWRRISFVYKCDVWLPYHVFRDPYSVIQTSLGPHLATVDDVDVDGKVRIDQAHLVLELLGHALSRELNSGYYTHNIALAPICAMCPEMPRKSMNKYIK